MRRYLWIAVACVLPLAFLYLMNARPPRPPGEEMGASSALAADPAGFQPPKPVGAQAEDPSRPDGKVQAGPDAGGEAEVSRPAPAAE